MKKVLVIVGPTAVGKTDLSLKLAKEFNGEIISGDSIQIYKGFDIGSGKIKDMQDIKHFGIDCLDCHDSYSVYDFQKLSRKYIDEISQRNHLPMIVGGTGLYIKACLYDYDFSIDKHAKGDYSAFSNQELYDKLKEIDFASAQKIHINNRVRLERALDIAANGELKSSLENKQKHQMLYDALIIGCTMDRNILYERINQRVLLMVKEGLKDEVSNLLAKGATFDDQPMKGIGYRQWQAYFAKEKSEDEVIVEIQKCSRNFAKRQYTWFNNQLKVHWVDMQDDKAIADMYTLIKEWVDGRI